MSRIASGQPVVRKPTPDIYSVLLIIGTVVSLLGLVVILLRSGAAGLPIL